MTLRIPLLLFSLLLFSALSCQEEDEDGTSEGSCITGCPEGSGYPCPCVHRKGCPGDQVCGTLVNGDLNGFCAKPCEFDEDCFFLEGCSGRGRCILENTVGGWNLCALTCHTDDDCPYDLYCTEIEDKTICYPAQ